MSPTPASTIPDICLDEFAGRQWDPNYTGTKICGMPKERFMGKVLEYYNERKQLEVEFQDRPALVDGYAPFCKHIFIPCFLESIKSPTIKIDSSNEHLLCTRYEARTEKELPVLVRYFPADKVTTKSAKYLDLILYSREQIELENAATNKRAGELEPSPWRLISIKAQDEPHETPMNPITCMRNGIISAGGSGVPIDRDAYMKSVQYWSTHALVS
jgi:hypothetical protein